MIWMQQVWRNKGAELYLTATGERDVYQFKSIILTIKLEKLSFFSFGLMQCNAGSA